MDGWLFWNGTPASVIAGMMRSHLLKLVVAKPVSGKAEQTMLS